MSSFIFASMLDDLITGSVNFDSDPFRVILVDSRYVPNKQKHSKRGDISNEVVGAGYQSGGKVVAVLIDNDVNNDLLEISLGGASWSDATIKARGAIYLKAGNDNRDELVAYIDFGTEISSINGTFSLSASMMRIQN